MGNEIKIMVSLEKKALQFWTDDDDGELTLEEANSLSTQLEIAISKLQSRKSIPCPSLSYEDLEHESKKDNRGNPVPAASLSFDEADLSSDRGHSFTLLGYELNEVSLEKIVIWGELALKLLKKNSSSSSKNTKEERE